MDATGTVSQAALTYWQEGLDVIPIKQGTKRPHPAIGRWGGKRRKGRIFATAERLAAWWAKHPDADVGIVLSEHLVAVDIDPRHNQELADRLMPILEADTLCARTPQGGCHAFMRSKSPTATWRPIPGIELLATGCIVVMPPSQGRSFANKLDVASPPDAAEYLGTLLGVTRSRSSDAGALLQTPAWGEGQRHTALLEVGGILRKAGFRDLLLLACLEGLNQAICKPPLTPEEIESELAPMVERLTEMRPEPFAAYPNYEMAEVVPGEPVADLQYLIKPIVPSEGITLAFGQRGHGKTYLGLLTARAVSRGVPLLDMETRQTPVLYVDWERRGKIFRRRLTQLAMADAGKGAPIHYVQAYQPLHIMLPEIRSIIRLTGAGFLILDSLTIALMTTDVIKDYAQVIQALFRLADVGIPTLVFDHQRKPQPGESDAGASAFGTVFKEAVASMVWHVGKPYRGFRSGGMSFSLTHIKNNFDLSPPDIGIDLVFQDSGAIEVRSTSGVSLAFRLLERMQNIPNPDGWTIQDFQAHTGASETAVRYAVGQLVADGKVTKLQEGRKGRGMRDIYTVKGEA